MNVQTVEHKFHTHNTVSEIERVLKARALVDRDRLSIEHGVQFTAPSYRLTIDTDGGVVVIAEYAPAKEASDADQS